jgi:hypothetical protein
MRPALATFRVTSQICFQRIDNAPFCGSSNHGQDRLEGPCYMNERKANTGFTGFATSGRKWRNPAAADIYMGKGVVSPKQALPSFQSDREPFAPPTLCAYLPLSLPSPALSSSEEPPASHRSNKRREACTNQFL